MQSISVLFIVLCLTHIHFPSDLFFYFSCHLFCDPVTVKARSHHCEGSIARSYLIFSSILFAILVVILPLLFYSLILY